MKILALPNATALMLLVASACFAPAALLDARLDAATKGQLRLADTGGTVWRGRGVVIGQQHTGSLPVHWKLDPWSLIRGDVVVAFQGGDGIDMPRGKLAWRNGALALDDIAVTLPAASFDAAFALGNSVALGGELAFDAPHFALTGNSGEGSASARWSDARIAGTAGTLALGTVTINFAPRDGGIVGRVESSGGDIRVDGEITLRGTESTANITLSPLPSTPPAIARALGALGTSPGSSAGTSVGTSFGTLFSTPDANGAVRVQWRSGNR